MFEEEEYEVTIICKGEKKTWTIEIPKVMGVTFRPEIEEPDWEYFTPEMCISTWGRIKGMTAFFKLDRQPHEGRYGQIKVTDTEG